MKIDYAGVFKIQAGTPFGIVNQRSKLMVGRQRFAVGC